MRTQEKGNTALSKNIRYLLDKHGETITSLSRVLHITRQSVAQYVDGKGQPNADKLLAIAEHFGVSVDYLLGRTDTPTTDADERACCDYTGLSKEAVDWLHKRKDTDNKIVVEIINALFEDKDSDLAFMLFFSMFDYATSQFSSVVIKDNVMKSDRKVDTDEARALLKYYAQETFSLVLDRLYSRYTALSISVAEATIKVKEYEVAQMEGDNHDGQHKADN